MNISSGILFSMIRLPKKVPLDSSACFDVPCSPGVFPKVFVLTTSASEKHRADVGEAQIKTSRSDVTNAAYVQLRLLKGQGSGQGLKGNGLVCTRGQGPHLYTRPRASSVHAEWFCCMYTFVLTAVYFVCSMCAGCQVHNNAFWTCVKYVPKQSIA